MSIGKGVCPSFDFEVDPLSLNDMSVTTFQS